MVAIVPFFRDVLMASKVSRNTYNVPMVLLVYYSSFYANCNVNRATGSHPLDAFEIEHTYT